MMESTVKGCVEGGLGEHETLSDRLLGKHVAHQDHGDLRDA